MGTIKIGKITLGICETNFYILYREGSKKCVVIDPADKGDYLFQKVTTERGFEIEAILLTHAHFDHIWGASELRQLSGAKMYAYEGEQDVCESAELNESQSVGRACTVKCNSFFKDGDEVEFADIKIKVIATPGHTHGSCCYYIDDAGILISGDTLFAESVGRTDLATGSMSSLVRSIKEKLMVLPEDTIVYPGHGPATTIEHEKQNNPFL